ncbi:hypothetical protein ACTFIT_001780 [Dictyostelium discoideum]
MPVNFTINDVLLNKESYQKKNKYTCAICFEFIYKKSIFQCKSGHIACQECWEKSLKNKKECMICRSEVNSINDLSRCLVIEQNLGKRMLNSLEEHENQCSFKLVKCDYCACDDTIQMEIENHHKECSKFPIDCPQIEMKRSELQNHLNNVNHQYFMSLLIEKLISSLNQSYETQDELEFENIGNWEWDWGLGWEEILDSKLITQENGCISKDDKQTIKFKVK